MSLLPADSSKANLKAAVPLHGLVGPPPSLITAMAFWENRAGQEDWSLKRELAEMRLLEMNTFALVLGAGKPRYLSRAENKRAWHGLNA